MAEMNRQRVDPLAEDRPSSAGSRVSAASTATKTTTPAEIPSAVTIGIPASHSEPRATMTVLPAKATAEPDVAPSARWTPRRHALAQLRAVAGDDEERVVDPDAEPDHRREGRGDRGDLDQVPEQADEREAAGEAEDRRRDREAHRDDGPEGEEQDDHRGQDSDRLARAGARLRDRLAEVAADADLEPRVGRGRGRIDDHVRLVQGQRRGAVGERHRDVADRLVVGERVLAGRRSAG